MCLQKNNELTDQYKAENTGKILKGYKILKRTEGSWLSPFYDMEYNVGENHADFRYTYKGTQDNRVDAGLHLFTTLDGVYRSLEFVQKLAECQSYNSYSIGKNKHCYIVEVEYNVDDLIAVGVWYDYITDADIPHISSKFVEEYPTDQVVVSKCSIAPGAFENAIKID